MQLREHRRGQRILEEWGVDAGVSNNVVNLFTSPFVPHNWRNFTFG